MSFSISSSRRRNLLAAFAAIGLIIRIALAFRNPRFLAMRPYLDDTFYVLSIAKHLALGQIPSIDGSHLTNGFQPLIAFLYVPLSWISPRDDWFFVRLTFMVQAAIFTWLLYVLADVADLLVPTDRRAGVLAAFLASVSIGLFQHTCNGLETGLVSLMLLMVLRQYLKMEIHRTDEGGPTTTECLWFGVVLGLTVLARIDAAIFVACLALVQTARGYWRESLVFSVTAFFVSLPWWLFNLIGFGALMPISGTAEQTLGDPLSLRLERTFATLLDSALGVWYVAFSSSLRQRVLIACLLVVSVYLLSRSTKLWSKVVASTHIKFLLPFALFCLALTIYYTFFFGASHFTQRYLQPVRLLWFLVVPAAIAIAWNSGVSLSKLRKGLTVGVLSLFLFTGILFGADRYLTNYRSIYTSDFYNTGLWANARHDVKIGMLQSGLTSFMAPNVVNLDGKVNPDALSARMHGQLGSYIRDQHFLFLADWNEFVHDIQGQAALAGAQYDSIKQIGTIEILQLHSTRR